MIDSASFVRGTQRRFPPKCILPSQDNFSLFEIIRASALFSRKIQFPIESFRKVRILSYFRFRKFQDSFLYEKQLNLGSEMEKIKLQKIVRNLLDKLRKLYMHGTVSQKYLAFLKLQKILGSFCFSDLPSFVSAWLKEIY